MSDAPRVPASNSADGGDSMLKRAPRMLDVTVDWSLVPAEDRASVEMALALGVDASDILAALGGAQAVAAAEKAWQAEVGATVNALQLSAAFLDLDDAACERLLQEMAEVDAGAVEAPAADDDNVDNSAAPVEPTTDGDGMGDRAGTAVAEGSWGGEGDRHTTESWDLSHIMRRRKAAEYAPHTSADYSGEEFYWEYLCVWQRYPEATWERGAFLRDLGFAREVDAFDRAKAPAKPTSTRKLMPWRKPSRAELLSDLRVIAPSTLRKIAATQATFYSDCTAALAAAEFKHTRDLVICTGKRLLNRRDTESDPLLREAVEALLRHVIGCACAANQAIEAITFLQPESAARFADHISAKGLRSECGVVFHGTTDEAVMPIRQQGLRIPGGTLAVRNGSALGLGIYSAVEMITPSGYTRTGDFFVCAAWAPRVEDPQVKVSGTVRVFFANNLISPIMHLKTRSDPTYSAQWVSQDISQLQVPRVYTSVGPKLPKQRGAKK